MSARIASIHFAPVGLDRSIYGGVYHMEAVPLDGAPLILEVEDKVQRDEGPITTGPGSNRRQQLRYHVDAYAIARDAVEHWTTTGRGMTPDAHPGIWLVRDRMPEMRQEPNGEMSYVLDGFNLQKFRPATTEEARAMWAEDLTNALRVDRAYAQWCYVDGNRIAADARNIQFIPANYKRAARQYGLPADWLKEGAALEVRPCPSCTTIITKSAMVCPKCNEPVDVLRWAAWQAQKDAAVKSARQGLQQVAA